MPNSVRLHRERKRWTLKRLSAVTGIAEAQLSRIERGLVTPRGITEERIAEGLQVPRHELFPNGQFATTGAA